MHSTTLCNLIFLGVLTLLPHHHILSEPSYQEELKKSGERKLSVAVNPGCLHENCNSGNGSLVHVRSDSSTDSLHFIWNFFGCPTLLLARTDLTANFNVDWDGFFLGKASSLSFDPPELYSFGTSLVTIWTFDDKLDQVEINKVNQNDVFGHPTKDFLWQRVPEDFVSREDLIQFSHVAREYNKESLGPDGYVNITVKIRHTDGYSDILPYMYHNGNSSQVDISFNQIQLSRLTAKSRIGLGYIFVQQFPQLYSNSSEDYGITLHKTKELADERNPGVFEIFSLRTPIVNSNDQSYLEWKPIGYTAPERDMTDSVDVHVYPMVDNSTSVKELLEGTSLSSFYGISTSTRVHTTNITFGTQGDGFFNKTLHISWTYMTGMELDDTVLKTPIELQDQESHLASPTPPPQDPTESETTTEDEDNKTMDTSKTAEIPSFSEWTKLQLSKKQETLLQVQTNGLIKEKEGKKEDGKNFASPDCGAKILMANPEAQNPHGILSSSHDEYMLNRCGVSSWFIIELCDSIKLEKISIGNLELFSSSPKDIEVGVSDRYPTRDWIKIGPIELPDARAIHSFPITGNATFSKYIRIQVLSHHGHEHYCPVSVVRFYGKSEFDVIDAESSHGDMEQAELDDRSPLSEENIDSSVGPASKESMIKIAADTVINMVKNAAQVLVKRGSTDESEGPNACRSTTNCLASTKQQQVNVTEICNWKLLYFVHANSHYFSKKSSCKAILNSHSLGSPSQIEGFWRALFGDGILQMVCSYTSPLQMCSHDAASSTEEITMSNELNGNLTVKTKTNTTPTPNGGNGNGGPQQTVTQEPIPVDNSNNFQQPIPPILSETFTMEKASVIEEESRTQNKESVFVRLTNRIKALERNQSLSSGYLEELSQRFKKQSEESYTISQNLKKSLNETASKYKWIQEFSRRESNYLRRSVADLRVSLWKTDMQRGFLVFLAMVQFIGMFFFCCTTRRRISSLEDKLQTALRSQASPSTVTTGGGTFDHSGRVRLVSESQQHPIVPRKRSNSHPDVMKPKKKKKKKDLLKQSASNVFTFVSSPSTPTMGCGEGNQNQPPGTTGTTRPISPVLVSSRLSSSSSGSVLLSSGQILQSQSSNLNGNSYNSSNLKSTRIMEGHSDPSSINRFGILASPSVNTLNSVSSSVSSTTSTETLHKNIKTSTVSVSSKPKGKKSKLKSFMPRLFDK